MYCIILKNWHSESRSPISSPRTIMESNGVFKTHKGVSTIVYIRVSHRVFFRPWPRYVQSSARVCMRDLFVLLINVHIYTLWCIFHYSIGYIYIRTIFARDVWAHGREVNVAWVECFYAQSHSFSLQYSQENLVDDHEMQTWYQWRCLCTIMMLHKLLCILIAASTTPGHMIELLALVHYHYHLLYTFRH